jgi:sugar/nucleoside kinase (ribokinase family)
MQQMGIDVSHLSIEKNQKTAIAVYWLMHGNRKRPFAYEQSAFDPWPQTWSTETEEFLLDTELLHCGGYLHYSPVYFGNTAHLYKEAKAKGILTSIDTQFPLSPFGTRTPWMLNMTDILPYVDVLITDENEAINLTGAEDTERAARILMDTGIRVLVVKFGKDGSKIYYGQDVYEQKAVCPGELVDSIGAGDAYGAAFLTYYMEGRPIPDCAEFAATVAGFSVTALGGISGVPTREQAENFIKSYKG